MLSAQVYHKPLKVCDPVSTAKKGLRLSGYDPDSFSSFYSIWWKYYPKGHLCCKYWKNFWIYCISNLCFLWMSSPCVCALSSSKLWLQVSCKCHRNLGLAGHSCSHLMHEGHKGCLYLHCPREPKNGVSVPCPTCAASWAYSSARQLPTPSPLLPDHPAPAQLDAACCLLPLALRPARCSCLPDLHHLDHI